MHQEDEAHNLQTPGWALLLPTPEEEAASRYTPAWRLTRLARHADPYVRAAAVRNPRCPQQTCAHVAETDDDRKVLLGVVSNHNCSTELLVVVHHRTQTARDATARDQKQRIATAILSHRNCPVELLTSIADAARNFTVCAAIIGNERCPQEVFDRLVASALAAVTKQQAAILVLGAATSSKHCSAALFERLITAVPSYVAESPRCPPHLLAQLANMEDEQLSIAVAGNVNCPPAALAQLANNPDWLVRATAAGNPMADQATLRTLAADPNQAVQAVVAKHPSCPPDVQVALLGFRGREPGEEIPDEEDRKRALAFIAAWAQHVAPYGQAVEEVAWDLVCRGFTGTFGNLAATAAGAALS